MNDTIMRKYLSTYAELDVALLESFPANLKFDHCVVIPIYNETPEFFTRLQLGPLHNKNALYIAVINQPDTDADVKANKNLMRQMCLSGEVRWHNGNMQLLHYSGSNNHWLIVDRFSHAQALDRRLPASEGVGLARKVGCDLAAALAARSQVTSGWIHTTDADAFLPKDYFELPDASGYSATIYRFSHQNDGSPVGRATATYEQALRYYVNGLAWAGSPYAYHTIGSILAVNAHSYCHVRGFPRRSGGEDFYLLNKLTKLGELHHTDKKVRVQARLSNRVPFGTGPAVEKILDCMNSGEAFTYYHPRTFACLKKWLNRMPEVWTALKAGRDPLADLSQPVVEALRAGEWATIEQHIKRQVNSSEDAMRALHNWFDAFRTLKFIHYLQEHYYPALPLHECLDQAEFAAEA